MSRRNLGIALSGLMVVSLIGNIEKLHAQSLKIGLVDVTAVFDGYEKSKTANENLNQRRKIARDNLDLMNATLKDLVEVYNELSPQLKDEKLSAEKKEEVEKDVTTKLRQIQQQRNQINLSAKRANSAIQQLINLARNKILGEITGEIEAYSKEKKFDYVFDVSGKSSTNVPPLLYHSKGTDITKDIITRLNAKSKKSKPAEKPKAKK